MVANLKGDSARYAAELDHHERGHALYRPPSTAELQVGQCGYFNREGTWNMIALITEIQAPLKWNMTVLEPGSFRILIDDKIRWGPMRSSTVTKNEKKLDAGFSEEVTSVKTSVGFELAREASFGTVLLTEAPIVKEYLVASKDVWHNWVNDNSQTLFSHYQSDLKEFGLSVITETYSTKEAYITIFGNSKRSAEIGVKVDLPLVGSFEPQGGWSTDRDSEAWADYTSEENERRVVFISGHHYDFIVHPKVAGDHPVKSRPTGTELTQKHPEPEEVSLEIRPTDIGTTSSSTAVKSEDQIVSSIALGAYHTGKSIVKATPYYRVGHLLLTGHLRDRPKTP